jgi:integrase
MKITDTWLQAAIAKNRGKPKYRATVARGPDRPGLMVTIYSNGTAAFMVRYMRDGERMFMPLGPYGRDGKAGLSLADACDEHDTALKLIAKGIDPIEDHERRLRETARRRQEQAGADTVEALVERFARDKLASRKRPEEAKQLLTSNLVNAKLDGESVGKMKARDLTRRQLVRLLDAIKARPAPIMANRVHALLVQLFTWAAAREDIPASPMAGIPRPTAKEAPRDRMLTVDEIRAFWSKLDSAEMSEPTRLALRLLLVTAQRRGEITLAKWSHFDLDAKVWTIPVALLKSAHSRREKPEPHVVPLSPLALELLRKLKALTGEGTYVLPQRLNSKRDRSYSERVLSRAVRENQKHFGIPHFTPHDLRRTAASFMTRLKVPRLHVEKVLNHSTGDIAEVYDRHDYLPEKRAALEKWDEHLRAIVEGREQTVIHLAKAAG